MLDLTLVINDVSGFGIALLLTIIYSLRKYVLYNCEKIDTRDGIPENYS